ncbi:serine protease 53-like isoform X2 [Melanaphis sacchari]|nr:serine protease 53-like isoform X2 [Melanaphis sacchari]
MFAMSPRCNRLRCLLVFLPALAVMMLLADRCLGSDNNNNNNNDDVNNNNGTATSTVMSASELSSASWAAAATDDYSTQSPLTNGGNDTASGGQTVVGKPSKFDEHVEDWQYVDDPLKNVTTTTAVAPAPISGNSTAACKMCSTDKAKTRRNKRNHDVRLLKMAVMSSRHRDLYAQLLASVAAKQSYRRKRFRRALATSPAESSTYKQLFRYKRYRRSVEDAVDDAAAADAANTAAEDTAAAVDYSVARSSASKQLYRRKRFRRSAVAAYPNGMIRPYHYTGNNHYRYQQPQHGPSLAADLQLQQNRRRRYRYAADPYHHKRNGAAATAWDRSAEFRRRYLRFPPTHEAPPPAYNNILNGNPWSPAAVLPGHQLSPQQQQQPFSYLPQYPIQPQQPPPAMGPRSPRLVFRDPVDQGTLQAPFGGGPNGLQDLLVSQPDDVKGCGVSVAKQQGAQRRIVGGDEAGFGSFPWQAYIRIGSSRCGGSLVNRYHVVTAGHCVARASARQVQVTLGDYVINSAVEPLPAYTFGVRKISVHPFFKFTPQADRFDVAVLRLDRPVQYMPHIAPICLPDKGEDFLGHYGWAAGWGALQAGSRLRPKTLQAVDVPIIDNRQCERWHKSNGINVIIYDEMMCAGYREGSKDSCQGDSGGPLMLEKTGRWYLIGIVSAGYSCAQRGQPGIYHRVALTVDWISYIINSSQQ